MVEELLAKYPIGKEIVGEEAKKEFVKIYSYIMRLFNILSTFDAFEGQEILSEADRQHYASTYIELYHEFKTAKDGKAEDVNDDIVFEMELIKQDEISIDRILWLINEYAKDHLMNKELIVKIRNSIDASPDLRNKKELIERFIENMTAGSNVGDAWAEYIDEQKTQELQKIIEEEQLKPQETKNFMDIAFRNGYVSITGTAFYQILPAMSRFAKDGAREKKRQTVYDKLSAYLTKFKDLSNDNLDNEDEDTMWSIPDPEPIEKIVSEKEEPKPITGENGGVKAFSIYQPWAQMLACGITQVENRNWTTDERGTFLIAASSVKLDWEKLDPAARGEYKKYQKLGILPDYDDLPTNAIVGLADLAGVVNKCRLVGFNPAFRYHFVVKNAKVLDEPILNHQTGKKFYETEILPKNMPAAHKAE